MNNKENRMLAEKINAIVKIVGDCDLDSIVIKDRKTGKKHTISGAEFIARMASNIGASMGYIRESFVNQMLAADYPREINRGRVSTDGDINLNGYKHEVKFLRGTNSDPEGSFETRDRFHHIYYRNDSGGNYLGVVVSRFTTRANWGGGRKISGLKP